jgi:hypothetical protein
VCLNNWHSSTLEKVVLCLKNAISGLESTSASVLYGLLLCVYLPFAGPFVRLDRIEPYSFSMLAQKASFFHWVFVRSLTIYLSTFLPSYPLSP